MRISQWPSCQPAGSEHTKRPRKTNTVDTYYAFVYSCILLVQDYFKTLPGFQFPNPNPVDLLLVIA